MQSLDKDKQVVTSRVTPIFRTVIAAILIVNGIVFMYSNALLYYEYNFTNKLFLYMFPSSALAVGFFIGFCSFISGVFLLLRQLKIGRYLRKTKTE